MGPIEDMALVSSTQTPAVKALSCVYIMFPFNGKDLDISSAGRVAVEVHFLGVVIAATGSNTSLYLSLIHISEPTRHFKRSRMPSSA